VDAAQVNHNFRVGIAAQRARANAKLARTVQLVRDEGNRWFDNKNDQVRTNNGEHLKDERLSTARGKPEINISSKQKFYDNFPLELPEMLEMKMIFHHAIEIKRLTNMSAGK